MRASLERMLVTARLILCALFPGGKSTAIPIGGDAVLRCAPRQIRGGLERLLNSRGELQLYFPGCLAIAAPVLLFRMKRQGYSRCSVEASERGLLVRGMR